MPTLLIVAGGTGGHIMPGLAVAAEMKRRAWDVVWLGNPQGMEAGLVAKHGLPMEPVQGAAARGKGVAQLLSLPFRLTRACWQAFRAVRKVNPAVVLGMGGYVAFPGGVMAWLLQKPLLVHEQNAIPGLTNKVLARIARQTMVAFPSAQIGSLKQAVWTGNPVNETLLQMQEPSQRYQQRTGPLQVLVVGGSLGAQALNSAVPRALALLPKALRPVVTHQSGKSHGNALATEYRQVGVEAKLVDFIEDMPSAYAQADIVICRAGAMTVSELAAAGVASVLVPFPHAVDDHQTRNAEYLTQAGAGLLMPQTDLTPDRLANLLQGLTRSQLQEMALKARALAKPLASQAIADACEAMK